MIRPIRYLSALVAILGAAPAFAAALVVNKSSVVVSDPVSGIIAPKAVPGAEVEYTIVIGNPAVNTLTTVNAVTFTDAIPTTTSLKVADYSIGNPGPVAFNGGLIGTSGLTYTFTSLSDDTDSLSFSSDNGLTWTYHPVADSSGYDSRVTNVKVVPSGSQTVATSFSIKFRVKVK